MSRVISYSRVGTKSWCLKLLLGLRGDLRQLHLSQHRRKYQSQWHPGCPQCRCQPPASTTGCLEEAQSCCASMASRTAETTFFKQTKSEWRWPFSSRTKGSVYRFWPWDMTQTQTHDSCAKTNQSKALGIIPKWIAIKDKSNEASSHDAGGHAISCAAKAKLLVISTTVLGLREVEFGILIIMAAMIFILIWPWINPGCMTTPGNWKPASSTNLKWAVGSTNQST